MNTPKGQLLYFANIRFPTERAHGVQVAHMCEAFAKNVEECETNTESMRKNMEVILVVPSRKTIEENPFVYYGVEQNFTIKKIPVLDWVRFGRLGFWIEALLYALRSSRFARSKPEALIYSRELLPLLFFRRGERCLVFEGHTTYQSFLERFVLQRCNHIVAISSGLKKYYVDELGIPEERIVVARDGVHLERFHVSVTKEEARERLGLPRDAKIAMYIGGLEPWKGVETFLEASRDLQKESITVVIIGGTPALALHQYKKTYPDIIFLGERPYRDLPINQQAANVLVIPNSGKEDISRLYTSPLKVFAHMTSGVPIVASCTPSLMEVLNNNNTALVAPDDSEALATEIMHVIATPNLWRERVARALLDVGSYSWQERALRIKNFLEDPRQT